MKKLLLFTALCILIPAQHVLSMDSGFSVQPLLTLGATVGFGLAGAGATIAACTVAHELGHATAGSAVLGFPINIHIGTEDVEKPLFSSKYFTINDCNIFIGRAFYDIPEEYTTKKMLLVDLAGPLTGIAASLLIAQYSDNKFVKLAAFFSATNDCFQLLPIKGTDGYDMLRDCGLSDSYADNISDTFSNPVSRTVTAGAMVALLKYNNLL